MKKLIGEKSGDVIHYTTRLNGRHIHFRAESETEISVEDARALQEKEEGRLVAGYSFDNFFLEREGGIFVATWECLSSCE